MEEWGDSARTECNINSGGYTFCLQVSRPTENFSFSSRFFRHNPSEKDTVVRKIQNSIKISLCDYINKIRLLKILIILFRRKWRIITSNDLFQFSYSEASSRDSSGDSEEDSLLSSSKENSSSLGSNSGSLKGSIKAVVK